jgi:two-component system, sensor histidine kinase
VLANLLSNAIRYGDPAKGSGAGVVISVLGLPNRVRVDIVDNGIGIPRAQWDKIFQPFVQLHNQERDREKGVGLGLSIINAIMPLLAEHRITMSSIEGKGTRFSLEIPRTNQPALVKILAESADSGSLPELKGKYVIYVEDDALVRKSTEALFETQGILNEAFSCVAELVDRLPRLEHLPDLLITDYRLPDDCTAEDVMRAVFTEFRTELPTIVLTGEIATIELGIGLDRPARILRKPVAPMTLFLEINALLNQEERLLA